MEFVWRVVVVACLVLQARCGDTEWGASVKPNELRVAVGANVTVRCTLLPAAPAGVTSDDIVWMYRARELPPGDATSVDNRTSEVTLRDLRPTEGGADGASGETLMCLRRRAPGEKKHVLLRSADVTVEWMPCVPSNFTCYMLDQTNVNCSWLPGDCKASHRNKYKLKYIVEERCEDPVLLERLTPASLKSVDCSRIGGSDGYHCQIDELRLSLSKRYWMRVESSNVLGFANSKMRCVSLWDIVKPRPPQNVLVGVVRAPSFGFNLTWEPPTALPHEIYPMQYEVEVTVSGIPTPRVKVVPTGTGPWHWIGDAEECSVYTVRVRGHGHQRLGFWSEWSSPVTHAVGELNPPAKGPDIWRVLADSETEDKREVTVLWEPLSRADARCCVQDYVLSITTSGTADERLIGNVSSYRLSLGALQYNVTVAARNSVGRSQANVLLVIPERAHQGPPPSRVTARADAPGSLLVTWAEPDLAGGRPPPRGYLVEWSNVSAAMSGRVRWRRVSPAGTSTTLADNFQEYVRYRVSVYASYQDGEGDRSSTYTYMKQGAPVAAPRNVLTHTCSADSCDIRWDHVAVEHLSGFLTHYVVYYWPSSGGGEPEKKALVPCASPLEDTCLNSSRLKNLEPNTEYAIQVAAVTVAGEGPRSLTSKAVTGFRELFFIMMLLAGLLLLCGGIITCICIIIVPARTKHIFFHKVPDPKNCSWAKDIDFSKPETLQGFLRITLSPSPDLRETEIFSEITVDSGRKLHGHLTEKAPDFDSGYTTAAPTLPLLLRGLRTEGEVTKPVSEAPFPSRALPQPGKLPLRAHPPAPNWEEYSQLDAMAALDGAPARPGPETHVYENSGVKAAVVSARSLSAGDLSNSLPAGTHAFALQQNNNSSAASPQGRPARGVGEGGGGAGSTGGWRPEVPRTVRTERREISLPCGVFIYRPQEAPSL